MWPMDFRFVEWYRTALDDFTENVENTLDRVEAGGPATRLPAVVQRRSDTDTVVKLRQILDQRTNPSRILQQVNITLKESRTTNDLLMGVKPAPKAAECSAKNGAMVCGKSAEYLMSSDVLQRFEAEQNEKATTIARKEEENKAKQQQKVLEKARKEQEKARNLQEKEEKGEEASSGCRGRGAVQAGERHTKATATRDSL